MSPRGLLFEKWLEVVESVFLWGGRITDGIVRAEAEAQPVGLAEVEGIRVKDADVHLPFFEIVGGGEAYAGGEVLMNLERSLGLGNSLERGERGEGVGCTLVSSWWLGKLLVKISYH